MRSLKNLFLIAGAFLSTTCTQYGGTDAPIRAAEALAIPAANIAFRSAAEFGVTTPGSYITRMQPGVFVAHPRGISLLTTDGPSGKYRVQAAWNFEDMAGVGIGRFGLGRQLQFLSGSTLLGVNLLTSALGFSARNESEEVFRFVREHGVSEFTPNAWVKPPPVPFIIKFFLDFLFNL